MEKVGDLRFRFENWLGSGLCEDLGFRVRCWGMGLGFE